MNLDLSSLTSLHEIVVVCNEKYDWDEEPRDFSLPLRRALETVSSRSLERVTLQCVMPSPELVSVIDWPALRAVFEAVRARSSRLRGVIGLQDRDTLEYTPSERVTKLIMMACERSAGEAIARHGMGEMVSVERMRSNWLDDSD
jgi:hypothetical protein